MSCWRSVRFSGFFHSANRAPFELLGELGLALAAGVVPHFAADLVERVGGELDQVNRVVADVRVRAALADRPGDP